MLLPAVQYGVWSAVKKRSRSLLAQIVASGDIIGVMAAGGMVDTATTPGMIMIAGITPGSTPHFHCFMPWKPLRDVLLDQRATPTIPTDTEDAIFADSLRVPWGVLGLLSSENTGWITQPRFAAFLDAVLTFWDELDAVGDRYYAAVQGKRLWQVHTTLHYVLANLGVPHDLLRTPLPHGGPRTLLKYASAAN